MPTLTKLEVCNMALAHCGVRVGFLETLTDETAEAQLCDIHFDDTLRETIMEFPWPHSLTISAPRHYSQIATGTAPWTYAYDVRSASDMDGSPNYTGWNKGSYVDFIEFVDPDKVRHTYRKIDYMRRGDWIHTDFAELVGSPEVNLTSFVVAILNDGTILPGWDAHFAYALSLNLATKLCGPLGAIQLRPFLIDAYSKALADAIRYAGNSQSSVQPPPDSEYVSERQG